jgi:dynein heavy chain
MNNILEDIKKACKVLREFYTLLGNDLKAVTGSSEQIDSVFDKVREYVGKLESFPNDVFKEDYKDAWIALFQGFEHNIETIENETISLIDMTFRDKLKSAEGAFDLLQKFKNIMTRPRIEEKMKNKYDDVLNQYDKELDNMRDLFDRGMKNTPISKNRPPKAGKICWARSIMGRIRAPIFKFKGYDNLL